VIGFVCTLVLMLITYRGLVVLVHGGWEGVLLWLTVYLAVACTVCPAVVHAASGVTFHAHADIALIFEVRVRLCVVELM